MINQFDLCVSYIYDIFNDELVLIKIVYDVVVYHVTIVVSGHGLLKKFWPFVIGCVLRTAGSYIIWNNADPLTSLLLNLPHPGHE